MMKKSKALILALTLILVSTAAWAQGRFEITPFAGYRTTGSFQGEVQQFSEFRITDGFAYGLTLGYVVSPVITFEAMWSRVDSNVTARSSTLGGDQDLAKVATDQFMGNFLFFFRSEQSMARPYFLFGLGATVANPKQTTFEGRTVDPGSATRFSWTLGLGVQLNASDKIGLRLQTKWVPTYINTTSEIW